MNQNIMKLSENIETSRVGKQWTKEEKELLIEEITNGKELDEIAKKHQRTSHGIYYQILQIASNMVKEEKIPIEKVSDDFRIEVEDIQKFINKQQNKQSSRKKITLTKCSSDEEQVSTTLTELGNKIDQLVIKIDNLVKVLSNK